MMKPVIIFKNAAFSYPYRAVPALRDFSVVCEGASIYAVIGPNGGGKSTFLQLCAGLLHAQSGTVAVSERPAYLPQQERIVFAFSVLEYVLFGRAPYLPLLQVPTASDEDLAQSHLTTLGIAHLANKRITEVSGGELQLIRFARILAQESSIYLLDEPTDMLDPAHVVAITKLIQEERARGKLIVMATHDLLAAQHCADYVVMIKRGKLQSCSPSETSFTEEQISALFDIPMHYTKALMPAELS